MARTWPSPRSRTPRSAYDYLKLLAGAKYQQKLVDKAGLIPNTNALLETAKSNPKVAAPAAAAGNGWFVPNSPKWGDVEASNALTDLTVNIFTGKQDRWPSREGLPTRRSRNSSTE